LHRVFDKRFTVWFVIIERFFFFRILLIGRQVFGFAQISLRLSVLAVIKLTTMKILSVALIFLSFTATAQQPNFKTNEKVFVYSIGLLNLRDSANTTATILAKLNLGDTAYIVETTSIKCSPVNVFVKDTVVANDSNYNMNPIAQNLTLQGQWVKIKYKNFVGFVNGIYLSSLPSFYALEKKYKNLYEANKVNSSALNDSHFFLLNKHYCIPKYSPLLKPAALLYKKKYNKKDKLTEINYTKNYGDGLVFNYEDNYFSEKDGEVTGVGGYTITITKKGISFAEAIMYGRAFFYYSEYRLVGEIKLGYFYNDEEKKYTITSYGEGGGCEAEIYKNKKGEWVISFGCGGC
jgi:hypothetical protein